MVLLSGPNGCAVFLLLSGRRRLAAAGGRRRPSGGMLLLVGVLFGRFSRRRSSGRFRASVGGRFATKRFQPAQSLGVRLLSPGAHLGNGHLVLLAIAALLLLATGRGAVIGSRRRLLGRAHVVFGRQQLMLGRMLTLQLLQLRLDHGQFVQVALDHRQTGRQPVAVSVAAAAARRRRWRFRRRSRLVRRPIVDLHVRHHPEPTLFHLNRGRRTGRVGSGGGGWPFAGFQFSLVPGRPLQSVFQLVWRKLGPGSWLPHVVPRAHRQLEPGFHDRFFASQPDQRRAVFGGQYTMIEVWRRAFWTTVFVVIAITFFRRRRSDSGNVVGVSTFLPLLRRLFLCGRLKLFLFTIGVTLTGNIRCQYTARNGFF